MCNRYNISVSAKDVADYFGIQLVLGEAANSMPNYNVAPTQTIATVLQRDGDRVMDAMRWGFIPSWAKMQSKVVATNAISEEIAGKPLYRSAWKARQRCLVPATGFFEWRGEKGAKEPINFKVKDQELFGLAGVYDRWIDPVTNQAILSCAILTVAPNDLVSHVHNRMPVIVHRDEENDWLSQDTTADQALSICRPYEADGMYGVLVDKKMGNSRWNTDECIVSVGAL
ncbi:DUF159 family protein [Capsulimonas corticalis]|uniref:Abasic site processing protein n=1 Tax=Capsulimonas corticalis TaxID=2219043 RepID=A0A9N7QGV9_9BACT|nr:SOS response-associated peptidase [Capsulimonas corticalis]BDI33986.1 DUF159 family protein [Capsulimonas corticalis]